MCHVWHRHSNTASSESFVFLPIARKGNREMKRGDGCSKLIVANFVIFMAILQTTSAMLFCPENQTARLGGHGYVSCNFPHNFQTIYWFDNITQGSRFAIKLTVNGGIKSGPGAVSGNYDVLQDGSLFISNVSSSHQRLYRVVAYASLTPKIEFISLKVIVSPRDQNPTITCDHCYDGSYVNVNGTCTLQCSFNVTRPEVQLQWVKHSFNGTLLAKMHQGYTVFENQNGTYNSSAVMHLQQDYQTLIALFVCRASWLSSEWQREQGIIADFSRKESFYNMPTYELYMERNTFAVIKCGNLTGTYWVWKQISSIGEPQEIGLRSQVLNKTFSDIEGVVLAADGTLIFRSPQIYHEGTYACIWGDGQKEEIQLTSVKILVPPSPPHITISGCGHGCSNCELCQLKERSMKKLSCSVYGFRPYVSLDWVSADPERISFFNYKEVVSQRNAIFDVTVSVEYSLSEEVSCDEQIRIKCLLIGPLDKITNDQAEAVIIPETCKARQMNKTGGNRLGCILTALAIVCLIILRNARWLKEKTSCRLSQAEKEQEDQEEGRRSCHVLMKTHSEN